MRLPAIIFLSLIALAASAADQLTATARYPIEPTGTMHFAEALTLSVDPAKPLTLKGEFLPIPGPTFRLSKDRYVMLGWSSTGSGMQTLHALLVSVADGAVGELAELSLTTDRSSAGLVVRHQPDGSLRIGMPQVSGEFLHDEEDWVLNLGANAPSFGVAEMRKFSVEAITLSDDDLFYAPPAQIAPRPTHVAWISIEPTGFAFSASGGARPKR
ncbi:MAG: hypothetical protein ABI411_19450 [Tahibacter sp.]